MFEGNYNMANPMPRLLIMTNHTPAPTPLPDKDHLNPDTTAYKIHDIFRDNDNTVQVIVLRSDGSFCNVWREFND